MDDAPAAAGACGAGAQASLQEHGGGARALARDLNPGGRAADGWLAARIHVPADGGPAGAGRPLPPQPLIHHPQDQPPLTTPRARAFRR